QVLRQKPRRLQGTIPAPLHWDRGWEGDAMSSGLLSPLRGATCSDEHMGACIRKVQLHSVAESIAMQRPAHLRKFAPRCVKPLFIPRAFHGGVDQIAPCHAATSTRWEACAAR